MHMHVCTVLQLVSALRRLEQSSKLCACDLDECETTATHVWFNVVLLARHVQLLSPLVACFRRLNAWVQLTRICMCLALLSAVDGG